MTLDDVVTAITALNTSVGVSNASLSAVTSSLAAVSLQQSQLIGWATLCAALLCVVVALLVAEIVRDL